MPLLTDLEHLPEALENRRKLRFRNGRFRILTFSDLHGVVNFDRRLTRDIGAILDKAKPDLVLLLGDIVWQDAAESPETLRAFLSEVVREMESRGILWAHAFGNHDAERGYPVGEQQKVYEEFPLCLSKAGPEKVQGTGNYILPLYGEKDERIRYAIWVMDSHRGVGGFLEECGLPADTKAMMPDPLYVSQGYDAVRFRQIAWYWVLSEELEAREGEKVPGMLAMHMPCAEYVIPYKNVAETRYKGLRREHIGSGPVNSGLYSALAERGDVKTIVVGHDHINDYEGDYLGIKMTYDAGINYDCYCDDDMRGGRIVDVYEQDPWHVDTFMIRAADCVRDYPGKEMRR
ncbi:MAG: metallophosphoesterase [Clostridia bacterium]|nr:metallophosphoesterase [Clostridia bacterium]